MRQGQLIGGKDGVEGMAVEHLEQGLRGRLAGATDVRVERGGDLLAGLNADGKADHALCRRGDRAGKGGAARSVSVSRCGALIREPQVFRFDRPLSNLHARLRVEMRAGIKALRRRLKTTTIHVTHDQIEAMTMADIVVVMHDGRRRFQMAANGPCLPVLPDSPGEIGQGVVDGLRPEHLAIDPAGDLSLALSPVAPPCRATWSPQASTPTASTCSTPRRETGFDPLIRNRMKGADDDRTEPHA